MIGLAIIPKTKFYFIRGFQHLRYINNFRKRRATTLFANDLNNLQTYLVGAILSSEAKGQEYYWEVVKGRRSRTATNKRDVAKHFKAHSQTTPDYYGLSIKSIASLFNCSHTRAVELKHSAVEAGYIQANHRFQEFARFSETDYLFRNILSELDPQIAKRLRFRATTIKGKKVIIVLRQLFDEIIPLMPFKTVVKFNNLKVPLAIIRHFGIELKKAAA